jgi:hypothetical protein
MTKLTTKTKASAKCKLTGNCFLLPYLPYTYRCELVTLIDIENLNIFIKIPLIVIWSIAMIFMLIAYFTYYYASGFIGKLIVVAENQKPFDNTGDYNIGLFSLRGLLPNVYRKTHKRIENILNQA